MDFLGLVQGYFLIVLGLVVFFLGLLVGGRRHRGADIYRSGQAMQRARDIARLRYLRSQLEADEDGLRLDVVYLLADVCEALLMTEGEAQHVMGSAYFLLESPVSEVAAPVRQINLTGDGLALLCMKCGRQASADEILSLNGYCQACWYEGYERDSDDYSEVE